MIVTHHNFSGEADKLAMLDLVRAYPTGNLHVADLPYRLSSWAFDYPENVGLWDDDQGKLLLSYGAEPALKNDQGISALDFASQRGHMDLVNFLLTAISGSL